MIYIFWFVILPYHFLWKKQSQSWVDNTWLSLKFFKLSPALSLVFRHTKAGNQQGPETASRLSSASMPTESPSGQGSVRHNAACHLLPSEMKFPKLHGLNMIKHNSSTVLQYCFKPHRYKCVSSYKGAWFPKMWFYIMVRRPLLWVNIFLFKTTCYCKSSQNHHFKI